MTGNLSITWEHQGEWWERRSKLFYCRAKLKEAGVEVMLVSSVHTDYGLIWAWSNRRLQSYLNVCVCGSSDPMIRFLFGFLLQHQRGRKCQPTPGRPSSGRGLGAWASASWRMWAAVPEDLLSTAALLPVELCSHWVDVWVFWTECCRMLFLIHWFRLLQTFVKAFSRHCRPSPCSSLFSVCSFPLSSEQAAWKGKKDAW